MAATDLFQNFPLAFTMPYNDAFAITKNDDDELSFVTRAVYVGGNGDLNVVTSKGNTVKFVGLTAGDLLPVRVKKVLSTGTTATNIVGLV